MTTTAITTTAKLVHSYLYSLSEETKIKKLREDTRNSLKEIIMDSDPDDKGNYNYYFDSPLCIDNVWYTGLQMQRRTSSYLDEERARELIEEKNLDLRCIRIVEVAEIDLDELYAANQEGIISDEEIDSLIQTDESYSLVRIKG